MDNFLKSIAPDQLIDLSIGRKTSDPSKYRIPAHLLSRTSDVLAADIEHSQSRADEQAFGDRLTLAYPYDKSEPWKLLLFWAYNKRLPDTEEHAEDFMVLIDAWLLGNKLAVPAFQDAVMLSLLNWHSAVDTDVLAYVCETLKPGTKVARFVAEEVAWALVFEGFDEATMEALYEDGVSENDVEETIIEDPAAVALVGLTAHNDECREAKVRLEQYGFRLFDRFDSGRSERRQWWMEFMVSPSNKKQGVRAGADGPVLSCLEAESLVEAVQRVSEDEDAATAPDDMDDDKESYNEESETEENEDGVNADEASKEKASGCQRRPYQAYCESESEEEMSNDAPGY